jgi:hypothetical protein
MDINLALALIRAGRAAEVVPHLAGLVEQISPLLRLLRQQKELQAQAAAPITTQILSEGTQNGELQGVPR